MPSLRYFCFFCLHDLRYEDTHGLCGLVLLLPRGVGVGTEREARVVVAEHTADGFDVHSILQCQRCEGMSEVVKSDVRQPGVLQYLLVQVYDGVWVVHLTGCWRGEHVGILGMLFVFGNQQVNSLLWNADFSDRCFRLRTGQGQFAVWIFHILLADGDGFVLGVEVAPEKRRDLALPQARDQFQIEHREQSSPVSGLEIILDVLRRKNLHFDFLNLRRDAVLGRVPQDQALLDCPFQGAVQHEVQTPNRGAAEPRIAMTALAVDTPILHQLLVELLEIVGSQLGELYIADAGNRVLLDHQLIAICC